MNQKPIFARVEFYNVLIHYFSIINKLLGFCSQHLEYALDFASAALLSISVSNGLDNLKSHREQISKMQQQIKAYKREVDDLSKRIKQSIADCKEKENESIITVKSRD
jgi:predicted transcriptional regulator